jgi:hypothetical protein
MTESQIYSVSDAADEILSQLGDRQFDIIFFTEFDRMEENSYQQQLYRYCLALADKYDFIKLRYIDSITNPDEAAKYQNTEVPDLKTTDVVITNGEAWQSYKIDSFFTFDENKELIGIVVNIACPSQVVEQRSFISSDYWGKVKILLREKFGDDLYVLGLCSPAGDQCPRDMIRWVEPESPINDPNIIRENVPARNADPSMFDEAGCVRAARRISDEIFYAYEDVAGYISDTEFEHKIIELDMPIRRVTIEEKDRALGAIRDFFANHKGAITFKDNAAMHVHAGTVTRYEVQQTIETDPIEMHVLRLGDVAFATNPYELFLNYGNQIRARSKAKQTFLIQLCCGSKGYLPTEKAEKGGHYSAYISSGNVGHEGGDLLARETVTKINKMFKD